MKIIPLLLIFLLPLSVSYADKCEYDKFKRLVEQQNIEVKKSSNHLHKRSKEGLTEYAEALNISMEYVSILTLHQNEYEFSNIDHNEKYLNKKNNFTTLFESSISFEIYSYKTEAMAIRSMEYFGKDLEKSKQEYGDGNLKFEIMNIKFSLDVDIDIERIGKHVIMHQYNKKFKPEVESILAVIKNCNSFDFEHYFSKSTVPIKFEVKQITSKQSYRNPKKEDKAIQDNLYTSEQGTENSFNKNIKLISKEYNFDDKHRLSDTGELRKVILKLKNTSDESFFSVDVFVAFYNNDNEIIGAERSIEYTIEGNSEFTVELYTPSNFESWKTNTAYAKTAYVVFAISNPLSN